jgi:arginyl-tRNA--protein-N-Asp/Glu arginylyltransferase
MEVYIEDQINFGFWIADCNRLEFKAQWPQLFLNPKSEI